MENVYDKFAHYEKPLNDFERARQQISTPFDAYDIDLSIARDNEIFNIAGDFLYIDMASTGYATIELNNQHDAKKAPFLVRKGFALGATYKQLKISNNAQAGAFLRIMSSTGDRVIPAIGDLNISGSVNTIEDGFTFGTSYRSGADLAAGGIETVFTPAANTNGFTINDLSFGCQDTSTNFKRGFLIKTSTPTGITDGSLVLGITSISTIAGNNYYVGKLQRPVKVPAGFGLYYLNGSTAVEVAALRSALYT